MTEVVQSLTHIATIWFHMSHFHKLCVTPAAAETADGVEMA